MYQSFLTFEALAREWKPDLSGATIFDAYSQHRNELTIAFERGESQWMLRVVTDPAFFGVYRMSGYNRKRANVVTLFSDAIGMFVVDVSIADRDRVLTISLSNESRFQIHLHGPRPNVFHVGPDSLIVDSFTSSRKWTGKPAPIPRPARHPTSLQDFLKQWEGLEGDRVRRLTRIFPLLTTELAAEAIMRTERDGLNVDEQTGQLYATAERLMERTTNPQPRIYRSVKGQPVFSLLPLESMRDREEEEFDSVDTAIRVFMRETVRDRGFHAEYDPVEAALRKSMAQYEKRIDRVATELSKPSRADAYEHFGHLLMAATEETLGRDSVEIADVFDTGELVAIPVDRKLDRLENARQYYDKARKTREARKIAESQWEGMVEKAEIASNLFEDLQSCQDSRDVIEFRKRFNNELREFIQGQQSGVSREPFRRFSLDGGWQVWVGRNAKENELLTFRSSKPYDTWLHARDVAGSHVLLRNDRRDAQPTARQVEAAASIAAYFSKAKTSSLVPVQVTQRKYVRKVRKGAPGEVRVDRERVVIVPPALP